MRIHDITIDMAHPEKEVSVEVKRGDTNMHQFRFTILENGMKFDYDGFFVGIKATKPDGKPVFNSCQPEDGIIVYNLSEALTQVLGEVNCELIFFKIGTEYISSPTFFIRITDNVFDEEDVISEEDLNGFRDYMEVSKGYAQKSEESATEAEASADAAAICEKNAEASATEAANSEESVAVSAEKAENAASEAELYKGQAIAASENAFNYMNSASSAASSAESNATAAANRAREAAESASAASNSASAAANSASAASVKASAAETSATAAANSASTATEEANLAGTAAGTAVQKAAEAEASADSAARSAENAATSEEKATAKASAAAASASTSSAKASEASNSASAAATSEANAAASAETATEKASAAAASASTASTKASEAEKSATSAGLAAAAAAQYAGQLESSADAAATSEANAAASAETATEKASAAAASASTASAKASAASNSESASANSASAAANSASAAEESATEAASSATAAANSASAAETSATEAGKSAEQAKNYYENLAQSGNVTGVKGSEEVSFRTGNVIITAENVGALPKDGNAASATKAEQDENGKNIAKTYVPFSDTGAIAVGTGLTRNGFTNAGVTVTASNVNIASGSLYYDGDTDYWYVSCSCASNTTLASYIGTELGSFTSNNSIIQNYSGLSSFLNVTIVDPTHLDFYFDNQGTAQSFIDEGISNCTITLVVEEGTSTVIVPYQVLLGNYNKPNRTTSKTTATLLQIGNGTSSSNSNALRLTYGSVMYLGSGGNYNSSGADYAEYFEWADDNSENEERRGLFVTFDEGNKIRIAQPSDEYILGAASRNACIIGNADEEWQGRWLKDYFGELIYETVEDEDGNMVMQPIENPEYDSSLEYIPRSERKEWDVIGMFGVLTVIDNGTCEVNSYATVGENGTAVPADENSINKYRVIKRISDNVIRILFK